MQFDFDSVRQRLINSLREKASWAEILFFSTNSRLVDSFSEEIANIAAYLEFLAYNQKWTLATEKSALVTHAQFMQYDPHRKIGARGDIRVSSDENFDSTYSKVITIPKYSVFSNGDELKFTSTQTENLLATDKYIDIPVVQGEPKTYTYIAQGNNYEEIQIENANIENSFYELFVNDILWTEVENLNASDEDDQHYELENQVDYSGINIIFGNNIFGKKLNEGDVVIFKYVETLGIEGNILTEGLIEVVESTIYDIDNDQVEMFCINLDNLDGGQDEEDIEDIRVNGLNAFQAGDKAVAYKDYISKIKENSFVGNAIVWGAYEYNLDNGYDLWDWIETQENLVNVSAFTPAGEQLTNSQRIDIIDSIKEDKPPTDIVKFYDTDFINLIFHIDAFVKDTSIVLSSLKQNIITGVQDRYDYNDLEFMQNLYETEWKGYINSINGVTYHNSSVEIAHFYSFSDAYIADIDLLIYPIKPETIKVYISNDGGSSYTLIATDDGNETILGETGYDTSGSSVNYDTGSAVLAVNSGLTDYYDNYTIKVEYQNTDKNIILNQRNQIIKIYDVSDITAQYID